MVAKPKLRDIVQISNNEESAIANLNANFQDIEKAIEDSVSRSGLTPTNMQTSLDMGGNPIINLGGPVGPNDAVRRQDIQDLIDQLEVKQAEIDSLVQQAKNTITQYVAEEVIPPVLEGVDTTTTNAASAASSASSASASATTATTKAEEAADSASLSQAWAVADDFDTLLEGESSSKAYANLAMAIANTPEDTPITMSDLQSQVILKGDPGEAATIAVGTVTTLPAGSDATVTNVGTSETAVFNFGIPKGIDGAEGKQDQALHGFLMLQPATWSGPDLSGRYYRDVALANYDSSKDDIFVAPATPSFGGSDIDKYNEYLKCGIYAGQGSGYNIIRFFANSKPTTNINVVFTILKNVGSAT